MLSSKVKYIGLDVHKEARVSQVPGKHDPTIQTRHA